MDAGHTEQARRNPLALIECLARDGRVLRHVPVYEWPVRLGRAMHCEVLLDDPHVAPEHARLSWCEGGVSLEVAATINGARVGPRELGSGDQALLSTGDVWSLGQTRLRLRLAGEELAPEQALKSPLAAAPAGLPGQPVRWPSVAFMLLAWLLFMGLDQWLDGGPAMQVSEYLGPLLGAVTGVLSWALLWSLGNKLFEGHLNFLAHLHRTLGYGLLMLLLGAMLPLLAYMLDWPPLSWVSDLAGLAVIGALVAAHLSLISPAHKRALALGVASVFVVGWGLYAWINVQRTGRVFNEQYVATLPPPGWRQVDTVPVEGLIQDARDMKAALDARAREDAKEAGDEAGFDG